MDITALIFALFGICFALLSISFAVLRVGDFIKGGVYKNRILVSVDYDLILEYEDLYEEYLRYQCRLIPHKGNYSNLVESALLADRAAMQLYIRKYGDKNGTNN